MLKNRRFIVFASILVVFASACGSGGIGGGSSVSIEQEWQLGDQMAQQVAQQMQLSRDAAIVGYIRQVGERIHAQTPEANLPFDFEVVVDRNVNAFSIPGGHVYVNTGLIAQADKVDMLAGVMAHEISHVIARHVIKQVEQQQAIGAIGSILLGQNPGVLQQLVAQIIAGGAMARFSRADEKQADDLGLKYMTAAGYDPHGMLEMFQKLASLEKGNPGAVERFFLDHPLTQDRINDIQSKINSMGQTHGIVDDPAYQSVRSRVGG
jgi:predicted Zn-dependent protease